MRRGLQDLSQSLKACLFANAAWARLFSRAEGRFPAQASVRAAGADRAILVLYRSCTLVSRNLSGLFITKIRWLLSPRDGHDRYRAIRRDSLAARGIDTLSHSRFSGRRNRRGPPAQGALLSSGEPSL